MKQWKQKIACLLAGIMVITGFFPWNSSVSVHAEESLIKSSAEGFEYRLKVYESGIKEYICTSDTTQVYDNYQDAVKGLADISRKILTERKAEPFTVKIPVEIKADQKVDGIEKGSNPFNDAVHKETYKETGNPNEGQGLAQFLDARGNLLNDKLDKITYDETTKSYKGVFYYHMLSHQYAERYSKTITKLKEVIDSLNLDEKSDYEKCKTIREWIGKNVKYDREYAKDPANCSRRNAHDMTGAILDGYAVCDGYANLFHYMANATGLLTLFEEGYQIGSGLQHAWNLVKIDGTFYYTDCTSIALDKDGNATGEFLLGQDTMFNLTVTPKNNDIENTYSNISKDDWSKEHSVCKGNHNLVKTGEGPATCETMGYTGYYCTNQGCIYRYRDYNKEPLGHNYDYTNGEITQSQDCTHPEITTYRCTRCKAPIEVETKPSLGGHKWQPGDIIKAPTCTVNGEQEYTCTVCNQTKTEPVKATGHDWQINKILSAATCTSNGIARYICKTCGYGENHTINATGHKPEIRNKKEATCSSTGYTGDTYCSVCNKKLSSGETINKKEHTWVKQDNIPATCEKGEMEVEKCSVCGETKETQISDPLGHDFREWKITKEPTCTKYGTKKRICKRCNEYEIDVINPTGHDWDKGTVKKAATCESEGIREYTCNTCKKTKEETIASTGHTKTEIRNKKAATCKEEGYTGDTYCVTCGKKLAEGKAIPKTDHDWTITETPATCEKDGVRTYICDVCHTTKSEPIKAIGHSYGAWTTTKEATISSKAEQQRTCSTCGKEEITTYGEKLRPTISTNATSLKLKKKQTTKKFTVTGLAKGDYITSWTSSNKKIVTVTGNQNGTCKIKAGSKTGKATITIKLASGLTKQIKVTVQKKAVTCSKIKNVPKTIKLKKKQTYQLKPVINPITCTNKIKYKSSNKKIAKVSSTGKITAIKPGKVKITISVGKKKFVSNVIIKK